VGRRERRRKSTGFKLGAYLVNGRAPTLAMRPPDQERDAIRAVCERDVANLPLGFMIAREKTSR